MLLCDADHGLAHDLGLAMTRQDGALVAVTRDGRRVWGRPDVAVTAGPGSAEVAPLPPVRGSGLPDSLPVGGERMDLGYVVGVLLGNRDLERRLVAERSGRAGEAA